MRIPGSWCNTFWNFVSKILKRQQFVSSSMYSLLECVWQVTWSCLFWKNWFFFKMSLWQEKVWHGTKQQDWLWELSIITIEMKKITQKGGKWNIIHLTSSKILFNQGRWPTIAEFCVYILCVFQLALFPCTVCMQF